ncbi:DNA translocase FtsK [Reinekea sp. G2M2-21]|uniref:DNA translocase FtsK n=1 Tax=Reinekea sp. G2M2-21 TaxID=2788942 RepID=UPI0018AB88A2|nr:DNA translocase FtsK [Reinekea sp. G2M2-21]
MAERFKAYQQDDRLAEIKTRFFHDAVWIFSLAIGLFLSLALLTYNAKDPGWAYVDSQAQISNLAGSAGAWVSSFLFALIGIFAYSLPIIAFYRAWVVFKGRKSAEQWNPLITLIRTIGWVVFLTVGCALATVHLASDQAGSAGGYLGISVSEWFFPIFGIMGSTLILIFLWFLSLTLAAHISWLVVVDRIGEAVFSIFAHLTSKWRQYRKKADEDAEVKRVVEQRKQNLEVQLEKQAKRKPLQIKPLAKKEAIVSERVVKEKQKSLFDDAEVSGTLPAIDLLTPSTNDAVGGYSAEALEAMSRLLEIKLKDFGVQAEVTEVAPGPVITRFEIQPAAGVKVSKISNLAKDLARSMALVSVRVVEIIPGKTTVGIEIPNEQRAMVRLSDVLGSSIYDKSKSVLTMGLGHDIGGTPVVADLAKMPHLLVAGTTGSGKSVGVNSMLCSLLFKATPEEVRLILVDPKMLELSVYEGIPHLLTPVITDMKEAAGGLRWCVAEMERRYKLLASVGVRNIGGFNKKVTDAIRNGEPIVDPLYDPLQSLEPGAPAPTLEPLPYIVVVIDEFADMMMIVGKKVEELIARIAQKARAAGIHLILATQRPSVDVITGLIKANIPTRIAFQVSSKIDSRTILDQGGAEQLLGHGDMLYMPPGTSLPVRVHGAFVDDDEVHAIVADWKKRGAPDYLEEITSGGDADVPGMAGFDSDGDDPESDALFDQAVEFVTQTRKASISSVQRKLRIGYNRAARLVETMEAAGIVSPPGHNGAREVLAPPPPPM